MTTSRIKILCVADYYLPGFRGGGPIRTIANMRRLFADEVELMIFTRDRDLGSNAPYSDIQADTWTELDDGPVYYASPKNFGAKGLDQALAGRAFDLLYLNSFFSFRASIQMYLWFRRNNSDLPILLAPRGEFSPGALALKRLKKRIYLTLVRAVGLYGDIQWQASSPAEKDCILRQFPSASTVHIAEDPIVVNFVASSEKRAPSSPAGQLRLAFVSRISPMKNLRQLLQNLSAVSCRTEFDIFGPIEDAAYWSDCQDLISELPPNVTVFYNGVVDSERVSSVFADYDLFAFPTLGENFGHVIFEALRAGTPVLISDRTPWKDDPSGAVTTVPLEDTDRWTEKLEAAANRSGRQKEQLRANARAFAEAYAKTSCAAENNLTMFNLAAGAHQ